MGARVNAGAIPQFEGDLGAVASAAARMVASAMLVSAAGVDVVVSWQGLSSVYVAPEAQDLYAVLGPVRVSTDSVASNLLTVSRALTAYVAEMTPIAARLTSLKRDAQAFRDRTKDDTDWAQSQDLVNENNGYIRGVNTAVVAFTAAERRCANAIEAVHSGRQLHAAGAGGDDGNTWGYTAIPDNAPNKWGKTVSRHDSCPKAALTDTGRFVKGFAIDGWLGLQKSMFDLVNVTDFDTMKQSWEGIGQLALVTNPIFGPMVYGPKGEVDRLTDLGKNTINYDMWKTDPSRAAGSTVFTAATILVPIADAAAIALDGVKAAELSARAAKAAELAGKAATVTADGLKVISKTVIDIPQLPPINDFIDGVKVNDGITLVEPGKSVVPPAPDSTLGASDKPGWKGPSGTPPEAPVGAPTELGSWVNTDRSVGIDPETGGRFRPIEYNTALRIQQERGITLARSKAAGDWFDVSTGEIYDAVGGFDGQYFAKQWSQLQEQVVLHLLKANFVPFDVSGFNEVQIAMVREFIAPYGPRVFMVGVH